MSRSIPNSVAGLILAGGLSRRMGGGDKALIVLGGAPLIEHARRRLAPQVETLLVSANGDPARLGFLGVPILADSLPGHPGPLAGILTGLDHLAATRPDIGWMATIPTDSPLFPPDLVVRLAEADAPLAVACAGDRLHPVFGLWRVDLRHALRTALVDEDMRRMGAVMERLGAARVEWPGDPFVNVNTPGELAALTEQMDRI